MYNKVLPFFIVLALSIGCTVDRDKKVDRDKFEFRTYDDTELFFKNMRQSYYDLEELKEAKINVFRFEKKAKDESNRPQVNLAIVMNWIKDEAYILTELKGINEENTMPLSLIWKAPENTTGEIVLASQNKEAMLEFATQVYEGINGNYDFFIKMNNEEVPVLNTQDDREAFRVTMSDYYRLTRVF